MMHVCTLHLLSKGLGERQGPDKIHCCCSFFRGRSDVWHPSYIISNTFLLAIIPTVHACHCMSCGVFMVVCVYALF